jgi:hypothetical protein
MLPRARRRIGSWRGVALCALLLSFPALAAVQEEAPQVDLSAPFVLAKGESMRVGPDGLAVTLRTIADESGCMEANDCSIMLFVGTIYLRQGDKKLLMELNASFRPEQPADFEFAEYKVLVTATQRVGGKLQASFRVEPKPAEDKPTS